MRILVTIAIVLVLLLLGRGAHATELQPPPEPEGFALADDCPTEAIAGLPSGVDPLTRLPLAEGRMRCGMVAAPGGHLLYLKARESYAVAAHAEVGAETARHAQTQHQLDVALGDVDRLKREKVRTALNVGLVAGGVGIAAGFVGGLALAVKLAN